MSISLCEGDIVVRRAAHPRDTDPGGPLQAHLDQPGSEFELRDQWKVVGRRDQQRPIDIGDPARVQRRDEIAT